MKIFDMIRHNDESGISGTGKVLTGVVFDDGSCVVRWCTETHTTEFCDSFADFKKIHIDYHPTNETELRWYEPDQSSLKIENQNEQTIPRVADETQLRTSL